MDRGGRVWVEGEVEEIVCVELWGVVVMVVMKMVVIIVVVVVMIVMIMQTRIT